ncbi:MAG: hypothetical protein V4509_04655 [Patescibacteria group bacterium]
MNPEDNFLNANEENLNESEEQADVLNSEPELVEEYPTVENYDRDALARAIREARD